jgi:methionyl-tRNA synthetase
MKAPLALAARVLVTTPIFYVNSAPHVGHLYTSLLADAAARYHRLARGLPSTPAAEPAVTGSPLSPPRLPAVFLVTGTDEHGQKVADAARATRRRASAPAVRTPGVARAPERELTNADIQSFTDGVAASFQHLGRVFSISADDTVRTTQGRHRAVVRWLWRRLQARGALEMRDYSGWYCRSDEAFVPELSTCTRAEYKKKRGGGGAEGDGEGTVSSESGHPVEWLTERNWVFRLTDYRDALLRLFDAPEVDGMPFLYPPERNAVLRAFVAGPGLLDLSVSRPATRVPWALRVPGDEEQSVYVWLDALANYLTAARGPGIAVDDATELDDDGDPATLFPLWPSPGGVPTTVTHILGKDIARFHAIYWPAFLLAAGLEPPTSLVSHAHFTVNKVKMSKSLGNVIDPHALLLPPAVEGGPPPTAAGRHVPDAIRYFLLREGSHDVDANFNASTLEQRCVKECSGTFGNLAHRLATPRFMPLGRMTLGAGLVEMPWSDLGCGPDAVVSGPAAAELDVRRLPPLAALLPSGATLSPSLMGHRLLRALPPAALAVLWPEPALGALRFSAPQTELLRSLAGLREAASSSYGTGRAGAALTSIMAVMQDANKVLFDTAPWKEAPSQEDADAWKAHAGGLLGRARGIVAAAWADAAVVDACARGQGLGDALAAALASRLASGEGVAPPPSPPSFDPPSARLSASLFAVLEPLRVCCVLLQPAMPTVAPALLRHLGFDGGGMEGPASGGATWGGAELGAILPHHFLVGRRDAQTSPVEVGPVPGPIFFPQPWEGSRRQRAQVTKAVPAADDAVDLG